MVAVAIHGHVPWPGHSWSSGECSSERVTTSAARHLRFESATVAAGTQAHQEVASNQSRSVSPGRMRARLPSRRNCIYILRIKIHSCSSSIILRWFAV